MSEIVLVTGGTGRLGRQVVPRLRDRGLEVRVLTRQLRPGGRLPWETGVEYVVGDLATGDGVADAVTGAGTILHCASARRGDARATRTLVSAAAAEGAGHLVLVSLVGADRAGGRYARARLEAERVVAGSGVPCTVQRVTQLFELVDAGARRLGRAPVVPVPAGVRVQPVDSRDVAERLAGLALDEPAGRVADLAGPEVLSVADVMREHLRAAGRSRPVWSVPLPGTAALRGDGLLPAAEPVLGTRTWREFLAEN